MENIINSNFWENLSTYEFSNMDASEHVAILPVAATEQHGPHLPLKLDRWVATSIVEEAAKKSKGLLLAMPSIASCDTLWT